MKKPGELLMGVGLFFTFFFSTASEQVMKVYFLIIVSLLVTVAGMLICKLDEELYEKRKKDFKGARIKEDNLYFLYYDEKGRPVFIKEGQAEEEMKQPRKLTRAQKELLHKRFLDPHMWMLVREESDKLVVINRASGNIRRVKKDV